MAYELEFIGPNDRPALLALSTPEWPDAARNVLAEIGYKVHAASNHDDFVVRFARIQYQLVLLEELLGCKVTEDNLTLKYIQEIRIHQRRHIALTLPVTTFA